MAVGELSDEALIAALRAHPELRKRVSSIVLAVEGERGRIEGSRRGGRADGRGDASSGTGGVAQLGRAAGRGDGAGDSPTPADASPRRKKLRWHTKFGEIEVREPQYRFGTQRVRPFVLGAKVSPLGCSRPLQRAIVDFAADQPFAQARAKLRGALRLRDRREHDPADHVRPRPGDA